MRTIAAFGLASLCACSGSDGSKKNLPGQAPFAIAVSPDDVPISPGSARWVTVSLTRDEGFTGDVAITVPEPPAGLSSEELTLAGDTASGSFRLAVDSRAAVGDLRANVVASAGKERASAPVTLHIEERSPESTELISTALDAGEIDLFTSLLYRCYARFGDELLPEKFRGSGDEDLALGDDIEAATPGLTPDQLADLRPYTVRPAHPESVYAQTAGPQGLRSRSGLTFPPETCAEGQPWRSRRSTTVPVRVWIECFEGEEAIEVSSMNKTLQTAEKVWPDMTGLIGDPLLDLGGDDEGGDDAIDIYLVVNGIERAGSTHDAARLIELDARAYTVGAPPFKFNSAGKLITSAFIVGPRDVAQTESFRGTLVHELFHVMQTARNRGGLFLRAGPADTKVHWFVEASAAWAKVHYDRTISWPRRIASAEHNDRFSGFQSRIMALNASRPVWHTYASYTWPLYLELVTGSDSIIGAIWQGLVSATSFDDADRIIDEFRPFEDDFRDFAVRNLNKPFLPGDPLPKDKRYGSLDDQFPDGEFLPLHRKDAALQKDVPFTQGFELPPLSAGYVHVHLASMDLGKVTIDTTGLQPSGTLDADALIETSEGWISKRIELDEDGKTVFCFDEGATTESERGSFVTMELVLSNHSRSPGGTISGDLRIEPSGAPCGVWAGTAGFSIEFEDENSKLLTRMTADVTLEYDDEAGPVGGIPLRVRAGNYTYSMFLDNYDGGCQGHGDSSGAMQRATFIDTFPGATITDVKIITELDPPQYSAYGVTYVKTTYYSNCNQDHEDRETGTLTEPFTWWGLNMNFLPLEDDGTSMRGSFNAAAPTGGDYHWTWNLTKQRE